MSDYSPEILKELQNIEVDTLEVFTNICSKYDINYFVVYGTAIGCIRHQGFIPWDDDIDVGMLWEDYVKLRSIPKEEWGGEIILCDPMDDNENHYFPYPRLYRIGTTLLPEAFSSLRDRKRNNTGISYNGIWIDIFIFHRFQTLEEIKAVKKRIITLRKQYLYSKKEKNIGMEKGVLRKAIAFCENTYSRFVNITSKSPEKRAWKRYMSLFEEKGDLITTIDYPYDNCPEQSLLEMSDIFPLKDVRFERLTLKAPASIEKHLRNYYGDYMKLPPEENRVNHAPKYLDLGQGDVMNKATR